LGGPGRVADGGGVHSMLQFWLERGGDEMKRYWEMEQRQQAHLSSIGRKCDMARWRGDVGRRRDSTGRGKGGDNAWSDVNLTGLKNKENPCCRFSCYKWTVNI
jgi:hypothetical protein